MGLFFYLASADSLWENGDIRLDTSDAAVGGRVEICYDGIWGSICNGEWTIEDATVACKQLVLPLEGVIKYSRVKYVLCIIQKNYIQALLL